MLFRSLIVALIALLLGSQASAGMARLVRHYLGRTEQGQSVLVCVYAQAAGEFERRYPPANFCPDYAESD